MSSNVPINFVEIILRQQVPEYEYLIFIINLVTARGDVGINKTVWNT